MIHQIFFLEKMLISEPRSNAEIAKDARTKSTAHRKPSKRERSINPVLESAGFAHEVRTLRVTHRFLGNNHQHRPLISSRSTTKVSKVLPAM